MAYPADRMELKMVTFERRLALMEQFVELKFCETFRDFTIRSTFNGPNFGNNPDSYGSFGGGGADNVRPRRNVMFRDRGTNTEDNSVEGQPMSNGYSNINRFRSQSALHGDFGDGTSNERVIIIETPSSVTTLTSVDTSKVISETERPVLLETESMGSNGGLNKMSEDIVEKNVANITTSATQKNSIGDQQEEILPSEPGTNLLNGFDDIIVGNIDKDSSIHATPDVTETSEVNDSSSSDKGLSDQSNGGPVNRDKSTRTESEAMVIDVLDCDNEKMVSTVEHQNTDGYMSMDTDDRSHTEIDISIRVSPSPQNIFASNELSDVINLKKSNQDLASRTYQDKNVINGMDQEDQNTSVPGHEEMEQVQENQNWSKTESHDEFSEKKVENEKKTSPKRKRGRPKKNLLDQSQKPMPKRRRGRPKLSDKNQEAKGSSVQDQDLAVKVQEDQGSPEQCQNRVEQVEEGQDSCVQKPDQDIQMRENQIIYQVQKGQDSSIQSPDLMEQAGKDQDSLAQNPGKEVLVQMQENQIFPETGLDQLEQLPNDQGSSVQNPDQDLQVQENQINSAPDVMEQVGKDQDSSALNPVKEVQVQENQIFPANGSDQFEQVGKDQDSSLHGQDHVDRIGEKHDVSVTGQEEVGQNCSSTTREKITSGNPGSKNKNFSGSIPSEDESSDSVIVLSSDDEPEEAATGAKKPIEEIKKTNASRKSASFVSSCTTTKGNATLFALVSKSKRLEQSFASDLAPIGVLNSKHISEQVFRYLPPVSAPGSLKIIKMTKRQTAFQGRMPVSVTSRKRSSAPLPSSSLYTAPALCSATSSSRLSLRSCAGNDGQTMCDLQSDSDSSTFVETSSLFPEVLLDVGNSQDVILPGISNGSTDSRSSTATISTSSCLQRKEDPQRNLHQEGRVETECEEVENSPSEVLSSSLVFSDINNSTNVAENEIVDVNSSTTAEQLSLACRKPPPLVPCPAVSRSLSTEEKENEDNHVDEAINDPAEGLPPPLLTIDEMEKEPGELANVLEEDGNESHMERSENDANTSKEPLMPILSVMPSQIIELGPRASGPRTLSTLQPEVIVPHEDSEPEDTLGSSDKDQENGFFEGFQNKKPESFRTEMEMRRSGKADQFESLDDNIPLSELMFDRKCKKRTFYCEECEGSFTTKESLEEHRRTLHVESDAEDESATGEQVVSRSKRQKTKSFRTQNSKWAKMKSEKQALEDSEIEKDEQCNSKNSKKGTRGTLLDPDTCQIKYHHRLVKCPYCGEHVTKNNRFRHLRGKTCKITKAQLMKEEENKGRAKGTISWKEVGYRDVASERERNENSSGCEEKTRVKILSRASTMTTTTDNNKNKNDDYDSDDEPVIKIRHRSRSEASSKGNQEIEEEEGKSRKVRRPSGGVTRKVDICFESSSEDNENFAQSKKRRKFEDESHLEVETETTVLGRSSIPGPSYRPSDSIGLIPPGPSSSVTTYDVLDELQMSFGGRSFLNSHHGNPKEDGMFADYSRELENSNALDPFLFNHSVDTEVISGGEEYPLMDAGSGQEESASNSYTSTGTSPAMSDTKTICPRCGKSMRRTSLKRHMSESCKTNGKKQELGGVRLKAADMICKFEDCGYIPQSYKEYLHHLNLHPPDKAIPCKVCNKIFIEELNLQDHMKTHQIHVLHDATIISIKQSKSLQPKVVVQKLKVKDN